MIINKGSYERGFAHGSVYKSVVIDASNEENKRDGYYSYFKNILEDGSKFEQKLEEDGLPYPNWCRAFVVLIEYLICFILFLVTLLSVCCCCVVIVIALLLLLLCCCCCC